MTARRFELHRDKDLTGVSGTGVVAEGVVFSDGVASMRWRGPISSTATYELGVPAIEQIHGHNGATRIVYLDPQLASEHKLPASYL